jgi:hypothetical protein
MAHSRKKGEDALKQTHATRYVDRQFFFHVLPFQEGYGVPVKGISSYTSLQPIVKKAIFPMNGLSAELPDRGQQRRWRAG